MHLGQAVPFGCPPTHPRMRSQPPQAEVHSAKAALDLLRRAARARQSAGTGINQHSSRSHAVFTVKLLRGDREVPAAAPVAAGAVAGGGGGGGADEDEAVLAVLLQYEGRVAPAAAGAAVC